MKCFHGVLVKNVWPSNSFFCIKLNIRSHHATLQCTEMPDSSKTSFIYQIPDPASRCEWRHVLHRFALCDFRVNSDSGDQPSWSTYEKFITFWISECERCYNPCLKSPNKRHGMTWQLLRPSNAICRVSWRVLELKLGCNSDARRGKHGIPTWKVCEVQQREVDSKWQTMQRARVTFLPSTRGALTESFRIIPTGVCVTKRNPFKSNMRSC